MLARTRSQMARTLFSLLLVLSVLAINPLGFGRAQIWVTPKASMQVLLLIPLLILAAKRRVRRVPNQPLRYRILVASAFLYVVGTTISTSISNERVRSLLGYPAFPEGALYYMLLVVLAGLAMLAAIDEPAWLDSVMWAVIATGTLNTLLAFPQKFNWMLDYTASVGQGSFLGQTLTAAGVSANQMPIGLTWHRGFVGYLAVLALSVSFVRYLSGTTSMLKSTLLRGAIIVGSAGVMVSDTRSVLVSMIAALVLGLGILGLTKGGNSAGRARVALLLVAAGLALGLLVSAVGEVRSRSAAAWLLGRSTSLEDLASSSGRSYLWKIAALSILQKPVLGHGYLSNHYQLARAQIADAVESGELNPEEAENFRVTQYSVVVDLSDGSRWSRLLVGSKPHNVILEHLQAVGLVGSAGIIALFGSAVWIVSASPRTRLVLVPVAAWAVFAMFWYESVQYSVLHWLLMGTAVGASLADPTVSTRSLAADS